MSDSNVPPKLPSLIESAQMRAPTKLFLYTDVDIDKLCMDFSIARMKRDKLYECLEGAAEVYKLSWQDPSNVFDADAAKNWVTPICDGLEKLLEMSSPLTMFTREGLAVGCYDRFEHIGIKNAVAFSTALLHLMGPYLKKPRDGWFDLGGISIVELAEWRERHGEQIFAQIKAIRAGVSVPLPTPRRKDKKLPLKMWTLCLARFWQHVLTRKVAITRLSGIDIGATRKNTINVSEFSRFCTACFKAIDRTHAPDLRTPIEAVRKHLDYETQVLAAWDARDLERYSALIRDWKDRIPLALPFDFVRST
jgi:hypothetical protein